MFQHPVIFLDTTDSTNLFARELINTNKAEHGTVIQAGSQLNGRGRRNSHWQSTPGLNLTFSIILFPADLSFMRHFELNQTFSLGIYDFLLSKGIQQVKVKWPNDILVSGRKIAGILLENTIRGKLITSIIAGIGININQEVFEGEFTLSPISVKMLLGENYNLETTLQEALHFIMLRYEELSSGKSEKLKKDYLLALFKLHEPCRFKSGDETWNGMICGITEEGELVIEKDSGKLVIHNMDAIQMVP